jgi:hypothetical protein
MYPLCTHELSTALLHVWTGSTHNLLIKLAILSWQSVVKLAVLMLYLNSLYLMTQPRITKSVLRANTHWQVSHYSNGQCRVNKQPEACLYLKAFWISPDTKVKSQELYKTKQYKFLPFAHISKVIKKSSFADYRRIGFEVLANVKMCHWLKILNHLVT